VDATTIGKRLRDIRNGQGLTQVQLAAKLGMPQALLSDYEHGKVRLHGGLIVAFAKALKVSADEILGLKQAPPNGSLKDRSLVRRMQKMEKLSKRERRILLGTIDTFLKGSGIR
jgi:transcriptional regulator with XRE-family HTH domain